MTDKEIVERAKEAEKRTGFGELVYSPISKGVNSAYGIGFIEGMVEYRNSLQEEPVSEDLEEVVKKLWDEINSGHEYSVIESYNVFYGLCLDIANWQKEQMMKSAITAHCFGFQGGAALFSFELPASNYLVGSEVKVIVIKED